MSSNLTFPAIPQVLDDDELPFVLGLAPDSRHCLVVDGVEYRRGRDLVVASHVLDPVRLRAVMAAADDGCYLAAFVGPIFNEWWPLLERDRASDSRRCLRAAVTGTDVQLEFGAATLSVEIHRGFGDQTLALFGMKSRGLSDENLSTLHNISLAVIKAALSTLCEYRTLVDPVPDMVMETGGVRMALDELLRTAAKAAEAIGWQLR